MAHALPSWKSFLRDTPGERFVHRYERLQGQGHAVVRRVLRVLGGIVLILVGVVFMVLPGPGIVPVLAGLALMASDSRRLAGALDRAELRVRRWWRRG